MKANLIEERCAYNIWLQQVSSLEQFRKFYETLNKSPIPFALYRKKTNKALGNFAERQPGICHYTLDDGIGAGDCRWENLYRVLVVR